MTVTRTPVVIGVGQVTQRDDDDVKGAEPLALILAAARAADDDTGGRVLEAVDRLELMAVGSWHYDDLPALVAERLGLALPDARRSMHPTGGETPLRALDVAAARIARGETRVCLLAGAEGTRAATRARRAGAPPPWTPATTTAHWRGFATGLEGAFAVGISRALNCFPLYENALRAHEGRSFADGQAESGHMWAELSRVAAANPYAWSRVAADEAEIVTVTPENRMVSFPYPKALVANPFVNQGAALLVTDVDTARSFGVPEARWIYPLGGSGADEPADPRARTSYFRVPALEAAVQGVQEVTGTDADDYDAVELYSCFPAMPKLTRRALGAIRPTAVSVTGGLSFFGGPGSNYMTHSLAAMVERLRSGGTGFLHGVGMFNTKHHALVLADHPRADGGYPAPPHAVAETRPPVEAAVPVVDGYEGPGAIETYSVMFGRDGDPRQAVVIGRGSGGERFAARVDDTDADTLAALTSGDEPVGAKGTVVASDPPAFRL